MDCAEIVGIKYATNDPINLLFIHEFSTIWRIDGNKWGPFHSSNSIKLFKNVDEFGGICGIKWGIFQTFKTSWPPIDPPNFLQIICPFWLEIPIKTPKFDALPSRQKCVKIA